MIIRNGTRPNVSGAFTLVELLVVVAIIGLLLSLLLPALDKALDTASIMQCTSNTRNIAQAMIMYTEENQRLFPGRTYQGTEINWFNVLGKKGKSGASYDVDPENRPLNQYLGENMKIAHCPLERGDQYTNGRTRFDHTGTSYLYGNRNENDFQGNRKVGQWGMWYIEGHRKDEVPNMQNKMVISDVVVRLNRPQSNPVHRWHNEKEPLQISIGFADGHAANIPRKLGTGSGQPAWPNNELDTLSWSQIEKWAGTIYY